MCIKVMTVRGRAGETTRLLRREGRDEAERRPGKSMPQGGCEPKAQFKTTHSIYQQFGCDSHISITEHTLNEFCEHMNTFYLQTFIYESFLFIQMGHSIYNSYV